MHHANHFYGHAHVLAAYCGLDTAVPPRIHGYLQHGWNINDGLGYGTPYVPGCPIFVWSEQTRRRAWAQGRRQATVTGAPWMYLLAMEPTLGAVAPRERVGTIWYPFHGWESQQVRGDHRRLIAEITDTEPGPVTVCLYWHEFQDGRLRRLYEAAGFRVICHGYRGRHWRDTETRFLHNQLTELRRHRRVASNRLSSAVFYGTAAGCEPAVYGDPMLLEGEDPATGGTARIRRQWPELHGTRPDPRAARETALAELGADAVASPEELREMFGWPRPERAAR